MKSVKLIAACVAALLLAAPFQNAGAQATSKLGNVVTALTSTNGINAGSALLGLYTQFKADGKLDFKNANNITNILKLASNISGLKSGNTAASSQTGNILGAAGNIAGAVSSLKTGNTASGAASLLGALAGNKTQASISTADSGLGSFVTGLISGSNNLVTSNNSNNVVSTLSSLANLDLSSIGNAAATTAASGLLSKLGGSPVQQSPAADNSETTQQASSLLSGLFKTFVK